MKPAPFTYHAPRSVDACLQLLAELGDDAAVMAGGQSLLSLMKFRMAQPAHVVALRDLTGELGKIRRTADGVSIGAAVTYARALRSPEVGAVAPALLKTIPLIAHPAVRTCGTICGSLCNADPAAELPAVALALDARMRLRSSDGERVVPAAEFFLGPYTTARQSNELLMSVEFPGRPAGERFAIREVSRLHGGFPLAGIALAAIPSTDGGRVSHAAIACFGVHAVQTRLPAAEQVLCEHGCSAEGIGKAGAAIDAAIEPHGDPFASADYRRAVTRTLFERAVHEICGGEAQCC